MVHGTHWFSQYTFFSGLLVYYCLVFVPNFVISYFPLCAMLYNIKTITYHI
jgi:hypothetical protein